MLDNSNLVALAKSIHPQVRIHHTCWGDSRRRPNSYTVWAKVGGKTFASVTSPYTNRHLAEETLGEVLKGYTRTKSPTERHPHDPLPFPKG
jgi:hypothetical protein